MVDLSSYSFLVLFFTLATSSFARNLGSRAEVNDANLRRLATANNDLALNIHRQLTKGSSENVFFSPLSLSTALGMLYYGTRGDTAEELRKALGYERAGLAEDLVHPTFRKYLTETLPSQDSAAYTHNSANAVLLDKQLDLVPDYKTDVQDYHQASVRDVDFAAQGPEVVRQTNEWVREKTDGKTDQLLDDLDASTLLVLLNAVYSEGTWKTEFDPSETSPWMVCNNVLQSNTTKTPTMRLTDEFPYAETMDAKVLEMPYKRDSMVILLPNELDGLEALERSLTPTKLSELRNRLEKQEVHVTVPKFKLLCSRGLSGELQAVGANKIFGPEVDFSGITKTNKNMAVSQVLHKPVIEVDEEGSEAAAVTGIISKRMGDLTPDFTVDRPFLFAIIDRRNGVILFMGRVTKL